MRTWIQIPRTRTRPLIIPNQILPISNDKYRPDTHYQTFVYRFPRVPCLIGCCRQVDPHNRLRHKSLHYDAHLCSTEHKHTKQHSSFTQQQRKALRSAHYTYIHTRTSLALFAFQLIPAKTISWQLSWCVSGVHVTSLKHKPTYKLNYPSTGSIARHYSVCIAMGASLPEPEGSISG